MRSDRSQRNGKLKTSPLGVDNERRLWTAVNETRRHLEEEIALDTDSNHSHKIERFSEIEQIVGAIVEGGANVRSAIRDNNEAHLNSELEKLRSPAVAGRFNTLIDQAIAEERSVVATTQADASALGRIISSTVPGIILLTLIVGLIAIATLLRSLTRSFTILKTAADAYSSGDLEHRSFKLSDVEFDRLAEAFNHMAEELAARRAEARASQDDLEHQVSERTQELAHTLKQLELADAGRRRFTADISHELRTPLTLIQGEAEMAMRGDAKSTVDYQDALKRIHEQAIHTTRLVKDLLLVARAEEGNLRIEHRDVELAELVEDVCDDFRTAALKRSLRIEFAPNNAEDYRQG